LAIDIISFSLAAPIADIDRGIAIVEDALSQLPRSDSMYISGVCSLAMARYTRFTLLEQQEDFDKSILHHTEAILLPRSSLAGPDPTIVQLLFRLVDLLLTRPENAEQPEEIMYSIAYLRYLRRLPLESHDIPRKDVTTSLIQQLATQVKLKAKYGIQNIEEMVVLCRELLPSTISTDFPADAFMFLSDIATLSSIRRRSVQLLNKVIECLRDAVEVRPPGTHRVLLGLANALATRARQRFSKYGLSEGLEEANSYHFEELLPNTLPVSEDNTDYLIELSNCYKIKFSHTNDSSDIEKSIEYSRLSLDSTTFGDSCRVHALVGLRNVLFLAFKHTNELNYLDESISQGYDILEMNDAKPFHFSTIRHLISSLLIRTSSLRQREDLDEILRLMPLALGSPYARTPDEFEHSCDWAYLARRIRHPSVLIAYKSAMPLMQKSLSFAPTAPIQHTHLVAMEEHCQSMPLDYASYQIVLGQFEEAIETLEQGRALIWSEMRGFRSPIAEVIPEVSPTTKRLSEIDQELTVLTTSITPSARSEIEDDAVQGRNRMDSFGRLIVKQRKLMEERDALIQGQPGLGRVLGVLPFSALRSAASHGPVILINHSRWHSDIMIIFHKSLPCAIPTTDDFYNRAIELRDTLMDARRVGLDSAKYQNALRTVLKDLYDLVGQPVLKRLRVLGVPEQSRIWWCPTSVFCSLPLHAMGPIPSEDMSRPSKPSKRYFSDLYIPSYTPSLSALIEARNSTTQALDQPSLLLVAQLDETLPGVCGEIEVIHKLRVPVTCLISRAATPTSVIEALRDHRFAHFACHGNLETGKPFDASFRLYGGERLTLLEVVRSRLPNAEFAFLSCCHTAEITEESVADEALHLTAAMQYCGFRSVVGTMWAMADTDGQDLAKNFYKSLFSSREQCVPYYERSARALRDAARKLRRKEGMTLERWVNFVHYGA
ncbi:CHAT domain containing protein, partial [Lactarius tabidus]